MLAEAFMDAIVWNGTSGSWNGVQADREMCEAITSATGVVATSSTLAQLDVLARFGVSKIGLAVPYLNDVTEKIIATYADEGYQVASHSNLGISVGRDMANVPLTEIRQLLRNANSDEVECLVVICTGLPAALVVDEMEKEFGKPIFDSVAVTLWKGMELAGLESAVGGWGALLESDDAVTSLIEPVGSHTSTG
jgi:maleate isomerase